VELFTRTKSAITLFLERQTNKRKTKALLESQQRYDLAVDGAHDGIWDINFQTGEVFYSSNWKRMLGYDDNEVANRFGVWEAMVHPDDIERSLAAIHEHWEKKTPFYYSEHRLRTKTGDYKWVFSRGKAVWDDNGKVVRMAGSTTDVTQRRTLELQLRQAQQMESIGRLAAGVAHDFNNLLTAIVGQVSLGRLKLPPEAPAREAFDKIEKASLQAADFCKTMMTYAGKGCYTIERVDLNEIVTQIAELVQHSISKKIGLRLDLSSQAMMVEGDASQLRHVMMNLFINGTEAIGDGSGQIIVRTAMVAPTPEQVSAAIIHSESPASKYIQLEVEDTGCGMSAEVLEKIFEPFFTTKITGRGLGLAAVIGVVKSHDGCLTVASELGKGTTFRILLKQVEGPATQLSPAPVITGLWRGSGTILLIEDEPGVREMSALMLKELGFEVLVAEDGQHGVDAFKQNCHKISAVILDWNMPRLNGEEAFTQIRAIDPTARVLLASGYSELEAIKKFKGRGLSGFLQKPYRFTDLITKLRECLG
jgi:PAS domain S-box-containing protein